MAIDPDQIQANSRFLRQVARALLRNEHDADDLVQETLTVALEGNSAPRGELRGWLVGVARNLARNFQRRETRRRRRERVAASPEVAPDQAHRIPEAEIRGILALAVARLPEPERSTVLLRYFDEESAVEIARRHGVTPKTVRVRLRRALMRLRDGLRRRYGRTGWIAALGAVAGLKRTAAAAWAVGTVAAAALLLVFVVWSEFADTGADRAPRAGRETVAKATPPAGERAATEDAGSARSGGGKKADDPPPAAQPVERSPARTAESPSTPAPPPARPAAEAGISNEPQQPLDKRGLTVGWGREAVWWSHGGRHFLVAVRRGAHHRELAFEYELWIREGSAPAAPKSPSMRTHTPGDAAFEATKRAWITAGRLLSRGTVHQLPARVHVLDREPGAVLFERHNHHGYGNTLSYIDWNGHLRWTLRLQDLFTAKELARFPDFDSSIAWSWEDRGFWVSESRGTALLMSVDNAIVEVSLATGRARRVDATALLAVVREAGPIHERVAALKAAARLQPPGLQELLAELARSGPAELQREARQLQSRAPIAKLLEALTGPAPGLVRSRKAIVAKWGPRALEALLEFARDDKRPSLARVRALHIACMIEPATRIETVVERRAPLLAACIPTWGSDSRLERWCERNIVALGDDGAAALLKHIREQDTPLQARREATRMLAAIRTDAAFDALVPLTGDADGIIAWHAANGLTSFPAKDLDQRFEALLLKGSPADAAIAEYFRLHPKPRVVDALLRAMDRHPDDPTTRNLLGLAVQRCSGQWVADRDDPAAWRSKLGH